MRIGFVGAGIMGHGMAGNLLGKGFDLTIIAHRNREPVDDLVGRGAIEVETLAALAERSDIIILCVTNSKVVDAVIDELKPNLRAGQIIVDCSTNEPESSRRIAKVLAALNVGFAEAPLTGGIKQAADGELGALVGADREVFDQTRPVLETFCKTVEYFGLPGTGQTAKLINNYMVLGIAGLVIEAFKQADTAGVNWKKLYDVAICGSGDSGVLRRMIGSAIENDFKGYVFDVRGAHKDLTYYSNLSEQLGDVSPLTQAVTTIFEQAENAGHGDRMISELLSPAIRNQ
jgi:3-hydroxyisobutyrate dehydrogenase-like beta-hydroxyacid dehydrogenase